jgi:hypothetical protein
LLAGEDRRGLEQQVDSLVALEPAEIEEDGHGLARAALGGTGPGGVPDDLDSRRLDSLGGEVPRGAR